MAWTSKQEETRQQIASLIDKYNRLTPDGRRLLTESDVVHQFLNPFLAALGWPTAEPGRFHYELKTQAGRPDMTLTPERGGTIFVEAKRFGVIQQLKESRTTLVGVITPGQLALPGMATDRTKEEQQAINYAFQNGSAWAILTNFEKLRLFNARRDWLVVSFEEPRAYLEQFEWLWPLAYENILNGRLDELSNQRHRADVDEPYLNFINEWRERLAQDIVHRPGDNWWAFDENGRLQLPALRAVVQRVLDRLVVVRFAEDHLIIPAATLLGLHELSRSNPYSFTLNDHIRQLFRRFDHFHNSALFAPDLADQAVFSDEVLAGLVEKLYAARYRAMSADIMGNTYEQYLGKTLVQVNNRIQTADNLETRKKQGSYYTPQVIVQYLVDHSLGRHLYATANGRPDGDPLPGESAKTAGQIATLRVLDPACGSGSFLIYAYEVLAEFYRREIKRLEGERQARYRELVAEGVTTPFELQLALTQWTAELERLAAYPRLILERHLYGVDLDPQAAEIATVNLMMRAMVDQPPHEKRLPLILNQNIKVGNSLVGPTHPDAGLSPLSLGGRGVRGEGVSRAEGDGDTLHAPPSSLPSPSSTLHAPPSTLHAFDWPLEFPHIFVEGETAGFDIIIGNPPWEILKPDLREYYAQFDPNIESKLNRQQVEARIAQLNALDPAIEERWQAQVGRLEATAAYFRRSPHYTRQGKGDTATHKLFLERAYQLLKPDGRLAFVIPSGIYSDLGTKELRELLFSEGQIEYLYSFSNERWFFPSVHHAFHFTLLGGRKGITSDGFWATFRFNPRVAIAPADLPEFLSNANNLIYIHINSLKRFSPDSFSIMEFQTKRDYEVIEKIYSNWPLLGSDTEDDWNIRLTREFDMTNDRKLFREYNTGFPLYEGKMIHQFDAYFAAPRFWIDQENVHKPFYRLGIRAIASNTNERSLISAILPPKVGAGNSVLTVAESLPLPLSLYLISVLNSFVLDMVLRTKVVSNINMFYLYQLPLPRLTAGNPYFDAIVPRAARLTCTHPAFASLWQAVMGEAWDESKGATPATAGAERAHLRAELDALVAHLYGLSAADLAHILTTFPLVSDAVKAATQTAYHTLAPVTAGRRDH